MVNVKNAMSRTDPMPQIYPKMPIAFSLAITTIGTHLWILPDTTLALYLS